MDYVETEGDTIDQAIDNALKLLAVERDKITADILSEGRRGILGFGSQKARIRAALRKSAFEAAPSTSTALAVDDQSQSDAAGVSAFAG